MVGLSWERGFKGYLDSKSLQIQSRENNHGPSSFGRSPDNNYLDYYD